MKDKSRLRRISGCRYTPAQRRMFGRKMAMGKARAVANAWQNEWEDYALELTRRMK